MSIEYKIKLTWSAKYGATFVYRASPTEFYTFDDRDRVWLINNQRMLRTIEYDSRAASHWKALRQLKQLGQYIELAFKPGFPVSPTSHATLLHRDLCLPDTVEVRTLIQQL